MIRLIFISQNEKFDEENVTFEQWPSKKPSLKYGQVPVLTLENGAQINESMAIAKYLARKANLYGKNDWEIYLIDRAIDTVYVTLDFYPIVLYYRCRICMKK